MSDIFHCFFCKKSLLNKKRSKGLENKHFFWCNKKCHDAYEAKIQEDGRVLREWSDFMCNEGPCPKEMLEEARSKGYLGENNWLHAGPPKAVVMDSDDDRSPSKTKSGRKCGKCGQPGHNARTCGRQKKKKSGKALKPRKKVTSRRKSTKGSRRRQYKCGKCGVLGHNARTCKANNRNE